MTMIRYITRWALSSGIRVVDGNYTDDGKYFAANTGTFSAVFVSADEAFETIERAQAQARKMADHKINSLMKQVAVLRDPYWKAKIAK
jgi:hypothetical protein